MKSEQWKNYATAGFYIIMALAVVAFTISYAFTDWEKVSKQIDNSIKGALEGMHCEVDYMGFHYKGFCTNPETVLTYVAEIAKKNPYTDALDFYDKGYSICTYHYDE